MSTRASRRPFAEDFGDSDSDNESARQSCFLCQGPMDPTDVKVFHQKTVHLRTCFPAIRACRRQYQGWGVDYLDELDAKESEDPAGWREEAMPYASGDRKSARAVTERRHAECERRKSLVTEEGHKDIVDSFEFDEGEYVTYFQSLNKFRSVEELRLEFAERLREEGNINPDPRGPPILRTDGKPRRQSSKGEKVQTTLTKKRALDDGEYVAERDKRLVSMRTATATQPAGAAKQSPKPKIRLTAKQSPSSAGSLSWAADEQQPGSDSAASESLAPSVCSQGPPAAATPSDTPVEKTSTRAAGGQEAVTTLDLSEQLSGKAFRDALKVPSQPIAEKLTLLGGKGPHVSQIFSRLRTIKTRVSG